MGNTKFLFEGSTISYEEEGMGNKLMINGVFQDKHHFVSPFGTTITGELNGNRVEVTCKSRLLYYLIELRINGRLVDSKKSLT